MKNKKRGIVLFSILFLISPFALWEFVSDGNLLTGFAVFDDNKTLVLPEIPQEQCTPEWVELKTSCQPDGKIKGFYVDVNDCYSLTGNYSHKQAPPDITYSCEFMLNKSKEKTHNHFISKDGTEWKIQKKDYIDRYIDYQFIYLNDDYYRVDWQWNNQYIWKMLKECVISNNQCAYVDLIKFNERYFGEKPFQFTKSEMEYINANGMSKKVLQGNAVIIGAFNPIKRKSGSFYIQLKEGAMNSNGVLIKIGKDSLLAQFNNSYTRENLTFVENQNITRYLYLDKGSNVSSAFLNISGYADITNASQIERTKTFSSEYVEGDGSIDTSFNPAYFDSDNTTHAVYNCAGGCSANGVDYLFAEYNISGVKSFASIRIIDGVNFDVVQGSNCDSDRCRYHLQLYNYSNGSWSDIIGMGLSSGFNSVDSTFGVPNSSNFVSNGISKIRIRMNGYSTDTCCSITIKTGYNVVPKFYLINAAVFGEGAVNPYIEVGTVDGIREWNWTGEFNESHGTQITTDFANAINTYLATCVADANNRCQVPVLFHSDTAGILEYSSINITYHNYPRNPSMDAGNDTVTNWNYVGELKTTVTTPDFAQDLQFYLDNNATCPPQQETCDIPLVFNSSSKGILRLSNLAVQYSIHDTKPPKINGITAAPNPSTAGQTITITANVTDNVNITVVNATLLTTTINLTYNVTSKLYAGTFTAPAEGNYFANITARDWRNLTAANSTAVNVTSTNAELVPDKPVFIPAPLEGTSITVNATVRNYGQSAANNFKVQLKVDGIGIANNTISVAAQSSTKTQFSWTATYGNHTIAAEADAGSIITESSELNNEASALISVLDNTSPIINSITAPSVGQGMQFSIKANATDNVNISTVTAEMNNISTVLTYNATSGLYEGTMAAPAAGTYPLTVKALDVNGLAASKQTDVLIYPTQADLVMTPAGIVFSELPFVDKKDINITAVVSNNGGTNASISVTEFLVDGISTQNITHGVLPASSYGINITWTATYGTHNLTFKADSLHNVTEADETNNEVSIIVFVEDGSPPLINVISIPPSLYVNAPMKIRVNATDNINISKVNATLGSTTLSFVYNSSSGLYENLSDAPVSSGTYSLNITAFDVNGLSSEREQPITINPAEADLTLGFADVVLTPRNPNEPDLLEVNITLHNKGGTDATLFVARFTVNGNTQEKNISVAKASANATTFNWTSTYSNHTLTISADATNLIAESNESNNNYTKSIFVADIVPPPKPNVTASPSNWTTQTTHTISWAAVNDTNGISRYEYQIDYGAWTSLGLNLSFTTSAQQDGVHVVYVRAVDVPGNLGVTGNTSLYIDNANPNTPIVKEWHAGKNWTQHDTPYYTWNNPGDGGSGVTAYIGELNQQIVQLNNTNSYHPALTSGSHLFRLYAQDALLHNSSWSNNITAYVDIADPGTTNITSSTHPDNNTWYNKSVPTFMLAAEDSHSGVHGYYYVTDKNESTAPNTTNAWTTSAAINISGVGGTVAAANTSENKTGLTDGTWFFHARAKDNVGNFGNTTHYFFRVDATAPGITNVQPITNVTNPVTVLAEYLDMHAGVNVSTVILTLDGNDITNSSAKNTTTITYTATLSTGQHTAQLQLRDGAGNTAIRQWNFTVVANESEGRSAIEQGITNAALGNYSLYGDQQLYVRYLNNTQMKGRFDRVVRRGNQTWAFNYITGSESFTNIGSLYNNTLVIWENQSLTTAQITLQVETIINKTKWQQ